MKRGLKEGGLVRTVYEDEPIQGRIEKIACGKLTIDVQIPYRGKVTVQEKDAFAMEHYNLEGIDKKTLVWAEYTDPRLYEEFSELTHEDVEITLDDVYTGVVRTHRDASCFWEWYDVVLELLEEEEGDDVFRPSDLWDEKAFLRFVLDYLDYSPENLEEAITMTEAYGRHELPMALKRHFAFLYDEDVPLSEEDRKYCRSCLLEMAGTIPEAKEILAYCYYGGNDDFPCDWGKARDMFLELLEENPRKADIYSNTLGYIYYYGRTNGGVPQYEEAFRYFSYGAACGVLESIYKVSDMLKNGYGIPKNEMAASGLITKLYEEEIVNVLEGNEMNKFADIALRMSSFADRGEFEDFPADSAYRYALQAQFAISKRQQAYTYYGDSKVAAAIGKRLEELKPRVKQYPRKVSFDTILSLVNENLTPRGSRLLLSMERLSDDRAKVTVAHKDDGMGLLVTLPERSVCFLSDSLEFTVKGVKLKKKSYTQLVDSYLYSLVFDAESNHPVFLGHECSYEVAEMKADSRETYRMALVTFPGSNRVYNYRCEGLDIRRGDKAMVPTQEGEKEVSVVAVEEYGEKDLLLPLESYKRILRVVERTESER